MAGIRMATSDAKDIMYDLGCDEYNQDGYNAMNTVIEMIKYRHNYSWFLTLRPKQNGRHFVNVFKYVFFNENICILIEISLKFATVHLLISQHLFR